MKILLGVDDSKSSVNLAQAIGAQFRTEDTQIRVLHVLPPISIWAPPQMAQGYAPELEDLKKPAHQLVEQIARELREKGFQSDTAIEVGDVRENLIDSAAEWGADLIVLGSHGQRSIQRFLIGSVAEYVARHARCSVQIVRCPPPALPRP